MKLKSSCHCPDMWLVGVIVFFSFSPFRTLASPVTYSLFLRGLLPSPPAHRHPHPFNLWSCSSRSAQSETTLLYVFPVAEAERCRNGLHLLQTLLQTVNKGTTSASLPKVPRQTIKLLQLRYGSLPTPNLDISAPPQFPS